MDEELEREIKEVLRGFPDLPQSEDREHIHHWKFQLGDGVIVRGCLYCGSTWVCALKKYPRQLTWQRIFEECEQ